MEVFEVFDGSLTFPTFSHLPTVFISLIVHLSFNPHSFFRLSYTIPLATLDPYPTANLTVEQK